MNFSITTKDNIAKIIASLKISKDQAGLLLSQISDLGERERKIMLGKLKEIYYLDLAEKESLANLDKYWA